MPNNDTSRRKSDWNGRPVLVRSIGFSLHDVENEMTHAGNNSWLKRRVVRRGHVQCQK